MNKIPIMPLRGIVLFPNSTQPLFVGRDLSKKAIHCSIRDYEGYIFLVAQRDEAADIILKRGELFLVGTVCKVVKFLELPDGSLKVLFHGMYRAQFTRNLLKSKSNDARKLTLFVEIFPFEETNNAMPETIYDTENAIRFWKQLSGCGKYKYDVSQDKVIESSSPIYGSPGELADILVPFLRLNYLVQQRFLETSDGPERLRMLNAFLPKRI